MQISLTLNDALFLFFNDITDIWMIFWGLPDYAES